MNLKYNRILLKLSGEALMAMLSMELMLKL